MPKDDEDRVNDILRDAIIGTENEIFGNAFGKEELTQDETGDRSIEAMGEGLEGQHEPEDGDGDGENTGEQQEPSTTEQTGDEETPEAKAEREKAEAEALAAEATHEPQGRVPSGRLREEAEKTRAAQAERDALKAQLDAEKSASQKAISDLNAKFESFLRQQQAAPQPKPEPPKPEEAPDLFENPTAFVEHIKREQQQQIVQLQNQMREQRINTSMAMARVRHGDAFDAAFNSLKSLGADNPDNRALVQRIIDLPDPGEAVVTWHKRNEALREVGDDPSAYKARIAEDTRKALMADPEFRKQLIQELRGEAATGNNGKPRTEVRLPASLNRAGGGNTRAPNDLEIYDGSESATFNSAWTT